MLRNRDWLEAALSVLWSVDEEQSLNIASWTSLNGTTLWAGPSIVSSRIVFRGSGGGQGFERASETRRRRRERRGGPEGQN